MSRSDLTHMTKVEVVVRGADASLVSNLLTHSGVTGYTSLNGVSGFGHHGWHEGRLLFNETDTLALIIAVMSDDVVEAVTAGLRTVFEDHSGVMFLSDTYVSRPAHFTSAAQTPEDRSEAGRLTPPHPSAEDTPEDRSEAGRLTPPHPRTNGKEIDVEDRHGAPGAGQTIGLAARPRPADSPVPRAGLTKMTKIEVVVPGAEVPTIRTLFETAGASGYTSVSGVSGLGHHGYHQGRVMFNPQDTLSLLITVVPDDRADAVLEGLRPVLERSSGVMFLSDSYVSRPGYFR